MINKIKKSGFTLVELMIAVAVLAITSGLVLLTMNNYNSNQAQRSVKSEIVANLRMARNLAKTMQKPDNFTGNLRYVEVRIYGNVVVEAWAFNSSGVGATYFSRNVAKKGVSVSGVPSGEIIFAPYEGKLMEFVGTDLVPVADGDSREILVGTGDFSETSVIEIGPQGVVEDSVTRAADEREFVVVVASPTPVAFATVVPTEIIVLTNCSACGLEAVMTRACVGVYCPFTCRAVRRTCGNNSNCWEGLCYSGAD